MIHGIACACGQLRHIEIVLRPEFLDTNSAPISSSSWSATLPQPSRRIFACDQIGSDMT
jgi:hypothetical protein